MERMMVMEVEEDDDDEESGEWRPSRFLYLFGADAVVGVHPRCYEARSGQLREKKQTKRNIELSI